MDGARFDSLTRALSRGATRRTTIAAGLAALAGAGGVVGAGAKQKKAKSSEQPCSRTWAECGEIPTATGRNYSKCDFAGIYLPGANLSGDEFTNATLAGSQLANANLQGVTFRGACLQDADLVGADLQGVNFSGADLAGAALGGADLRGAKISQSQLDSATVGCDTILPNGTVTTCAEGETCCHGTCTFLVEEGVCGDNCAADEYVSCDEYDACGLVVTSDGENACVFRDCGNACSSDSDCDGDDVCVSAPGCCGSGADFFCAAPCADAPFAVASAEDSRSRRSRVWQR